ncbi:uncharacterized protein LY89DRAFT_683419 [Mollisia scopiformis]|uniref:Uncharacterized protein n=1 Tax=Mollisia scopiformis TaxID=149040 RepID=A0A194XHB4_MOLSC|nr:uncharacterized protein LY89DRAFT_683419 [Mollisia scopiformis]KUJ19600.1 hypothetical protein LY89DRAFT_683419 [Mollisia scopiformis]
MALMFVLVRIKDEQATRFRPLLCPLAPPVAAAAAVAVDISAAASFSAGTDSSVC